MSATIVFLNFVSQGLESSLAPIKPSVTGVESVLLFTQFWQSLSYLKGASLLYF